MRRPLDAVLSAVALAVLLALAAAAPVLASRRASGVVVCANRSALSGPAIGGPDVSGATTVGTLPYADTGAVNGDSTATADGVYKIALVEGQRIYTNVSVTAGTGSVDLFVYGPSTTSVKPGPNSDNVVAFCPYEYSPSQPIPLRLAYTVPAGGAGTYYIDVSGTQGSASYEILVKAGAAALTVKAPVAVRSGKVFAISGALAPNDPAHAGTAIELWAVYRYEPQPQATAEKMVLLGTTSVGSDGAWKVIVTEPYKMPWASTMRVVWPGDANSGWVETTPTVKMYARVSIKSSAKSVARGKRVTLSGVVGPNTACAAGYTLPGVTVQGRSGKGTWRTLKKLNLKSSGSYRATYTPSKRAVWQFRTLYRPGQFKDWSSSAAVAPVYFRFINTYSSVVKVSVK